MSTARYVGIGRIVLYAGGPAHGPDDATSGCRAARSYADRDTVAARTPALRRLVFGRRVVGRGAARWGSRRARVTPRRRPDARPFHEPGDQAGARDPGSFRQAAGPAARS